MTRARVLFAVFLAVGAMLLVLGTRRGSVGSSSIIDDTDVRRPPFLVDSSDSLVARPGERTRAGESASDDETTEIQRDTGLIFVLVHSTDGRPVADADVWFGLAESLLDLPPHVGRTDSQGTLRLSNAKPGLCSIIVRHPGFAAHSAKLRLDSLTRIEVQLQPGASIQGVVVDTLGKPIKTMPTVFAWTAERVCSFDSLALALRGEQRDIISCIADAEGNFRLEGVELDREYSLVAAGAGASSCRSPENAKGGDQDVKIVLGVLRALRVLFTPLGEQGVLSGTPLWVQQPSWITRDAGLRMLGTRSYQAIMLQLGAGTTDRAGEAEALISVVDTAEGRSTTPTVHLTAHLAGFAAIEQELSIPEWATGPLPETTLSLSPTSSAWGVLHVAFRDAASLAMLPTPIEGAPHVQLRLWNHFDNHVMTATRASLQDSDWELTGVPIGTYGAQLVLMGETCFIDPIEADPVVLVENGVAHLTFSLAKVRRLLVDVVGPGGTRPTGPILIGVDGTDFTGKLVDAFPVLMRPPYLLPAILPGNYVISMYRPTARAGVPLRVTDQDVVERPQVIQFQLQ